MVHVHFEVAFVCCILYYYYHSTEQQFKTFRSPAIFYSHIRFKSITRIQSYSCQRKRRVSARGVSLRHVYIQRLMCSLSQALQF